jgi:hypothetical protein
MKTRIYGSSDDLVEVDGEIYDEYGNYNQAEKGILIKASDGTRAVIKYSEDGEWKVEIKDKGNLFEKVIESVGDDNEHTDEDAKECSSYSDVIVFLEGLEWIEVGNAHYDK